MLCRKSPSDGRERHRPPNLFIRNISSGCVFAEFPVPLEHPRVPHAAFNTPEQLIVRLARRMEGKHRKARIERVFRFALGGIVRITLAARAIAFEKPHSRHQVFFCGRDRVHKMRCVPALPPDRAPDARRPFQCAGGGVRVRRQPSEPGRRKCPAASVSIPTTNPRRNLRMAPPGPSDAGR